MKHRILPLLAAALLAGAAHAQIVIEERDTDGGRNLSDNFFGEAGFTAAAGSSHQRSFVSLEVGYDGRFAGDRGRIFVSAIASQSDIELDLELKQSAQDNPNNNSPQEMTLEEDDSDADLSDAYIQYQAPGNLTFTAGRARVSWGQFNLVSPVNLALPVTPQSNEASVRKVNLLVPQDQVSFSWFPHERVEVQGYHFFSTNIDSLVEEVTRNRGTDAVYASGNDLSSTSTQGATDRLDLTRHSHSAARLMFYPDWGTIGFTWHEGRKALAFSSNLATLENPGDDANVFNVRRHVDFPKADNFGFELAIPSGLWTWKFEMLYQETEVDLEGYSIAFGSPPTDPGTLKNYYDYFQAVQSTNNGKLYIPVDRYIFGIGAESDRDDWRFDFNLFAIDDRFDSTGDRLIELEEAAGFETDRDTLVFPAISVARYLGGDKEREAGVLAGFLGAYFGVSAYYTAKIGDDFRWTAGVEAASSLRDQFLSEREDRYELADDLSAGFRVSAIYNF
ncbi:MAG: hypothetical protein OXU71_10365 [Gammaproteobacteria bacterium]|nr:hypothetical protein [Gammaproteobacteria bacterium]